MERAALLSPSQLVFMRVYPYLFPRSVLSTLVPLMGIHWFRVWSRGCWEGAREGDFINTPFDLRPKNFNRHSKYIFNVNPESGHKRGKKGSTWINSLWSWAVFYLLSQTTSWAYCEDLSSKLYLMPTWRCLQFSNLCEFQSYKFAFPPTGLGF